MQCLIERETTKDGAGQTGAVPVGRRRTDRQFDGGRMTWSMTWMTPLVAAMSVATTWASSLRYDLAVLDGDRDRSAFDGVR